MSKNEVPWHKQFGAKDRWPTEAEKVEEEKEKWEECFRGMIKRGTRSTTHGSAYYSPIMRALEQFPTRKCECGDTTFVRFAGRDFRVEVYGDDAVVHVALR